MKNVYFTITGLDYRYGGDFLKKGMKVKLKKEPDNKYDREAIQVKLISGRSLIVICSSAGKKKTHNEKRRKNQCHEGS